MKILRNYILKEFFASFFVSIAVLTLVMLLGNLIRLANLVVNKGVNLLSVSKLFAFLVPSLLTYTLPIATLVAILLSLGRLSHDNEIIAIRSNGINILQLIIMPLLTVGLILSLILVVFNDRIVPYAHFASRRTMNIIGIRAPTASLEAGTFINYFNKYIVFIYRIDGNQLHQVRIYEPRQDNQPCRTIVAKRGEFISFADKGMVKLKLMNGTSDEPDPNNPGRFYKLNFKTLYLNLNLAKANKGELEKKPKDMTFQELNSQMQIYESSCIDAFPLITELHKRTALAFSVIIFILIGSSLAIITKRREKSINFSMAFGITGLYYLLLLGANALSLQGYMQPALAMWLPNILLGSIGLFLILKICAY